MFFFFSFEHTADNINTTQINSHRLRCEGSIVAFNLVLYLPLAYKLYFCFEVIKNNRTVEKKI